MRLRTCSELEEQLAQLRRRFGGIISGGIGGTLSIVRKKRVGVDRYVEDLKADSVHV